MEKQTVYKQKVYFKAKHGEDIQNFMPEVNAAGVVGRQLLYMHAERLLTTVGEEHVRAHIEKFSVDVALGKLTTKTDKPDVACYVHVTINSKHLPDLVDFIMSYPSTTRSLAVIALFSMTIRKMKG